MKRVGKLRAQDKAYAEGAYKAAPTVEKAVATGAHTKVGKLQAAKAILKTKPGKLGVALAAVAVGQEVYKSAQRSKKKAK